MTRKIVDYILVSLDGNHSKFIQEKSQFGYELYGSPFSEPSDGRTHQSYVYQAMVKYDREETNDLYIN